MRRVPLLIALVTLLIAGLLGMHALASGSMAATAAVTSSGHAPSASPAVADQAAAAPVSMTSGSHGTVHGCADAMSGGSTCVSVPTDKSVPALPAPSTASLPGPVFAVLSMPPPETPRRLALSHLELSICRT
ncbi:hypothetical protein SAMN04489751_1421 [Brevibacterium sandarakinum]|uniref:Secreted protein n=2 Tax=Brevibacteriaceae TaxID=85019 RepID=A0A1H1Q438_BRESA|nr:hypothetical protein SAMN04489751_1421 [Brevibacterium sandarakinum]